MCNSTIPVICLYNGKTKMIETDVKYVRNKYVVNIYKHAYIKVNH